MKRVSRAQEVVQPAGWTTLVCINTLILLPACSIRPRRAPCAGVGGARSRGDQRRDVGEHLPRHCHFGHLERDATAVAHGPRAHIDPLNLVGFLALAFRRSAILGGWRGSRLGSISHQVGQLDTARFDCSKPCATMGRSRQPGERWGCLTGAPGS